MPVKLSGKEKPWIPLLAFLLVAAGLAARLIFVHTFPTRPVSDFESLVGFGLWMRDRSVIANGFYWRVLNPGLPLFLSLLFRIFPRDPATTARIATAVATGLVPFLPLALWRGVLPARVYLLAAGMLALWPGQILFSGVVAQDNWVLLPTVALACVAVRAMVGGVPHPVSAGLLYALAVSVRQEMLVALFPVFVAAAFGSSWRERWRRSLLLCALAAGLPLLLLAWQRYAATGRFTLSTEHGGVSVLGSYIPGATVNAWIDPLPYVASVEPSLLENIEELKRQAPRLAWRAAASRPVFHTARIAAFTLDLLLTGEEANLVWSLTYPDAMPLSRRDRAFDLANRAGSWLEIEMGVLFALFLASLLLAGRKYPAAWVLIAAMVLKIGLHAVTVIQGRYLLAATALQILVIALVLGEALGRTTWPRVTAALVAGAAVATALSLSLPQAVASIKARDVDPQRTYRFRLAPFPGSARIFDCTVSRGRLTQVNDVSGTLETFHPLPSPGETAAAECVLQGNLPSSPLVIRLVDPYAPGGSPGRMEQRVMVDGREVFVHDVAAEPGSGPTEVPLGQGRTFSVELRAVHPDPWIFWSQEARTYFELARAQEKR